MINTLQLIALVPLFDLMYPEILIIIFNMIVKITRFNIIPAEEILRSYFTFSNTTAINQNFGDMDIF